MARDGRPTKYDPKYIEAVNEYLDENKDVKDETGYRVKLPTIEGFARFIGVNKTTLYEWESRDIDFSNALSEIRQEQQQRLLNNGLAGTYNPTIAKLVLSANHGMREKSDVTSDDKPIMEGIEITIRK